MFRSFFTATSGALTDNRNLTVISNNMANLNTTGYKRETPLATTFSEMLVSRRLVGDNAELGTGAFTKLAEDSVIDYSAGNYTETDKPMDFAILGEGFFQVQQEDGTVRLTRDGEMRINEEGFLELKRSGELVLNQDGDPIYSSSGDINADRAGNLSADGEFIGQLGIVRVLDFDQMEKVGEGFFTSGDNTEPIDNPQVLWKTLETSNVDMTMEMTRAIALQRSFQANTQVMKMIDTLTEKTVNEIART